ncbi:hypothetical protein AWB78_01297 [Caballeronia calidae]|uniref:Uncharacterized protein n=1 Tax=Caballeronia calidae TaxID=1777139 RepID=A0A158A631_9BURK|nr:hypothetical protein [Caballeronia calidae]SAK53145.1 hypothetical protein AWB78_01297 [Caballeronia calidae]
MTDEELSKFMDERKAFETAMLSLKLTKKALEHATYEDGTYLEWLNNRWIGWQAARRSGVAPRTIIDKRMVERLMAQRGLDKHFEHQALERALEAVLEIQRHSPTRCSCAMKSMSECADAIRALSRV